MQQVMIDPVMAPDALRAVARDYMQITEYIVHPNGSIVLHGQLLVDAHTVFRPLRQRFEQLGFTPFIKRDAEGVEVVARPGVIQHRTPRVWINVLLFVVTVVSVLLTGSLYEGADLQHLSSVVRGLPFMLTLLGILSTHEMGHFIVGRLRKAPMSWPYFIPLPLVSLTGTMGAVIVQREPLEDRRTLLEVGIAGPLAGLAVAIPLLFLGLYQSKLGPVSHVGIQEGNSLLYLLAKFIVFGQRLPGHGVDVQLNSVAWGAWIGLLITMLNLLPIGQLDGGHVAYALLGRKADYLAYTMIVVCMVLGILVSQTWFLWAVLPLLTGIRHPAPFNDVPGLDTKHTALAIFGLVMFVLLLVPAPLTQLGG